MKIAENIFLVFAAEKWNASGIFLKAGKRYRISPPGAGIYAQEWEDAWITCGPSGWNGSLGKFSSHMLNALLRVKEINGVRQQYFALMGSIGKSLNDAFLIGDGCEITAPADGELFAFANDASSAYGNNHGQIVVSVETLN